MLADLAGPRLAETVRRLRKDQGGLLLAGARRPREQVGLMRLLALQRRAQDPQRPFLSGDLLPAHESAFLQGVEGARNANRLAPAMVRRMRLSALLVLAAACGNPDNLVLGGISATATIPVASIDNVRSAISGIVTLNDANGNRIGQKVAIILTNTSGLCTQLGSSPDYFQNPPQDYVALILLTPLDQVGFFYFGRDPVAKTIGIGSRATGRSKYRAAWFRRRRFIERHRQLHSRLGA